MLLVASPACLPVRTRTRPNWSCTQKWRLVGKKKPEIQSFASEPENSTKQHDILHMNLCMFRNLSFEVGKPQRTTQLVSIYRVFKMFSIITYRRNFKCMDRLCPEKSYLVKFFFLKVLKPISKLVKKYMLLAGLVVVSIVKNCDNNNFRSEISCKD